MVKEIDVGQIIGNKYVLVRLLGAGAMGQVWSARHQALQQPFAVKLMVPPGSDSAVQAFEGVETSLRRFKNEAQIAAALSRKSRHIAQVTDYGIEDDVAYLVMELLEGDGLDKRIGDGRRLHPSEVSTVITQIAKGLTVAHAEGVTHRDLKPANVFLTKSEDGELLVKILDFGIAQMARRIVKKDGKDTQRAPTRLTLKGLVLGSPAYMSPEQAMAESPDARADVWSLAVLAFEALAGVAPFHAKSADETILRICNFQPTPLAKVFPEAKPELCELFERAFAARIEERYQTPAELAEALAARLPIPARELADTRPTPARLELANESGAMSLRVPIRPRKILPAIGAGLGVGLLVSGALFGPRLLARREAAQPQGLVSAPAQPSVQGTAAPSIPPPPATTASPPPVETVAAAPAATHAPTHARPAATARHSATVVAEPAPTHAPPATSVDRSAVF